MYSDYCPHCHGSRLSEVILSIKIGGLNIYELSCLQISDTITYFKNLVLDSQRAAIARQAVEEIISRLEFLRNVGLGYLSLNRSASSLSGGEFQRIRLATQIGSKLSGVLYVLDEPSIGLHQRDNQKLINSLKEMRDIGNSLIVVEHDLDMMKQSDYIIDIGPGAGESGGRIVALGTPEELMNNEDSLTGKYLSGKLEVPMPKERRPWTKSIKIVGASENNLKNIDVDIPLGVFVCVTGVSGSGKSTLVNEILLKTIRNNTSVFKERAGKCTTIENYEEIEKIIEVSQDPIGRTPRSNPATYTGVFDRIRDLYSSLLESKESGYTKSNFSFNVFGGRCESCQGDGLKKISMAFLPDVYVPCEVCNGARYNKETLKVFYKGKNISDVLNMTVNEAVEFFENQPSILPKIKLLKEVGLDYIKLGQNSVTLSGCEAQRVKLATELSKRIQPTSMYILDEPTTGLHSEDIRKLLVILHKIVDEKASIVVIEHNMDVIKNADYIIDLGPEGGEAGGQLIAYGTPEEIVKNENSFTGQYLKEIIK
jgi:excinuclease ABC subunit A